MSKFNPKYSMNYHIVDSWARSLTVEEVREELAKIGYTIDLEFIRTKYAQFDALTSNI